MTRPLTQAELDVIRAVAEKLRPERRRQLLEDVKRAMARRATPDGARIAFDISGYERPPYRGQHSFGVEGELLDRDGARLAFDLFADENDRLLELEVNRWDGGDLIDPNWSTLRLY